MDKTIVTALLIVISIVMATMLFNVAYPAVIEGGDAIQGMTSRAREQMRSDIAIIHTAGELDSDGMWTDTTPLGTFEVFVWVKNTGDLRLTGLESLDIFFGPQGNFRRIPHESVAGSSYPRWSWSLENAGEWTPTATLRINIQYNAPISQGYYYIKVTTANGASDETFMSM